MAQQEEIIEEYPAVDENAYEASQPHLKAALEHTIAMRRSIRDWSEFYVNKFGSTVVPYLKRFLLDVREQRITIEGLGDAARDALCGVSLTADERDIRIREKAYFRAQQRGFEDGSAEGDWIAAEREVDHEIAQHTGLAGRAREAVLAVGELAQQGFEGMKGTLTHWLEQRTPERHRVAE